MRNYVKNMYMRKELWPELLCVALISLCMILVPKEYNKISVAGLRVALTLGIVVAMIAAFVFLVLRLAKRNKQDRKFNWIRMIIVIVADLIVVLLVAYKTSQYGMAVAASTSDLYPVETKATNLAPIINSLVFGLGSQFLLSSITAGYEENKAFMIKTLKAMVFAGIPIAIVAFLVTRFLSVNAVAEEIFTVLLWMSALTANEVIDSTEVDFKKFLKK